MKKIATYTLLFALTGCKFLGIGKQCFTCTTLAKAGSTSTSYKEDVCCTTDMNKYRNQNSGIKNGVSLNTTCTEK
ncbi:hypothetical protein [Spirosoma fluminis]